MFIISLTYKVPLEKVDAELPNHVAYLNQQYALGNFEASGRKVPRTGGVIISNIASKEDLLKVVAEDPFYKLEFADYEITEFIPSKASETFSFLIV